MLSYIYRLTSKVSNKSFTILLLSLTLFTLSANAQMRGRVKIENGNVVADNGTTLRAAPFFVDIDWGMPHMFDNEQLYRDYFRTVSQDHNMNMVRACPWLGRYDYMMTDVVNSSTGETAGDRVKKMLDLLVQWSEEDGIYLMINAHSQIGTTVDFNKWKSFWDLVAPLYKDKTHVFYEATNEPEESSAINNMEAMYSHIRGMAPATHISLWTHWNCGFDLNTINSKNAINYNNASVAFHTYLSEGDLEAWNRAKVIRDAEYPVICSELWSLTNANDLPIDYDELSLHIAKGEELGMSWAQWGPYANYRGYNPSSEFDNPHDAIKFTSQYRSSIENRGVTYWNADNGGGNSGGGNSGGGNSNGGGQGDATIVVRAKGTSGAEQFELLVNDSRIGNVVTVTTSYSDYSFALNGGSGNVKVKFTNDGANKDLQIDRININGGSNIQAENQSTNTGAWNSNESRCGGIQSERLDCSGYIDFGTRDYSNGSGNGGGSSSNESGDITIRARGNCGAETMQLRIDGTTVQTWNNINTSQTNYTYSGYGGGDINVHFTNDGSSNGCDKNLLVNYIDVCGERYQTESTATRTGCGNGQWLWCTGNFSFGNLGCGSGVGNGGGSEIATIVVNARGTSGAEQIELLVNDARVGNLTTLSTSDQSYTFSLPSASGNIKVKFSNDAAGRDVRIDWIQINGGTVIQAENQSTNTGGWNSSESRCGGAQSEWLHCPGYIDFGNRNFRKAENTSNVNFTIYPNPLASKGVVTIKSQLQNYAISMFDIHGKLVYQKNELHLSEHIDLSHLNTGIFTVIVMDGTSKPQISKLIVR